MADHPHKFDSLQSISEKQYSPQTPMPGAQQSPGNGGAGKILLIILAVLGGVGRVIVVGCAGIFFFLLRPVIAEGKQTAAQNNLQIIGLAIDNYHSVFKPLP